MKNLILTSIIFLLQPIAFAEIAGDSKVRAKVELSGSQAAPQLLDAKYAKSFQETNYIAEVKDEPEVRLLFRIYTYLHNPARKAARVRVIKYRVLDQVKYNQLMADIKVVHELDLLEMVKAEIIAYEPGTKAKNGTIGIMSKRVTMWWDPALVSDANEQMLVDFMNGYIEKLQAIKNGSKVYYIQLAGDGFELQLESQ